MKTGGPRSLRVLTYFVLCLSTWIVFQVELRRGGSVDVFWLVAFLLIFLLFWGLLASKPRELPEAQDEPNGPLGSEVRAREP